MTHEEILKAARERIVEIGNDPAHDKERESLLTVVHGPRCQFCGQHECATKAAFVGRASDEPLIFNGPPCMMSFGATSTSLRFTSTGACQSGSTLQIDGRSRIGGPPVVGLTVGECVAGLTVGPRADEAHITAFTGRPVGSCEHGVLHNIFGTACEDCKSAA